METALARTDNTGMVLSNGGSPSIFLNLERFEFAKKVAAMLAASNMVPTHFQGQTGVGNCMIALNLSERLGVDVFALMQTSYVVHGRPGFEAKLLIALFAAQTRLFIPPLRWETRGDNPRDKSFACRAYAKDKETGDFLYGEWIDWEMVKAEGWDEKSNSKWKSIPGQMFRYRSASFFINAYEPGLKMGIMTVDELEDTVIDVTPEKPGLSLKPEGNPEPNPYQVKETPVQKPDQAQETTSADPTGEGKQEAEKAGQEGQNGNGNTFLFCNFKGARAPLAKCKICPQKDDCKDLTGFEEAKRNEDAFMVEIDQYVSILGLSVVERVFRTKAKTKDPKAVPAEKRADVMKALKEEVDKQA